MGKRSAIYSVWNTMLQRCINPNAKGYSRYGGCGISVCERWHTFENFLADMGERPSSNHSIDRFPNQNGNYEPGNCRWATKTEQARNTKSNRMIEFQGRTQCMAAWAEESGQTLKNLWGRLESGWLIEKALTTPIKQVSISIF
jgi:hypothetical protein